MRGKDNMRSGGEVLVDQLLVNGVRHVFCVPGESYLAALDAFHDRDVAVTVCRQEGGAVMMAEAHGKLTGRPGIAFVTRGPGATNGSPGIHIAKQDSTPLIMFVGQVAREMRDREAFQELDYRAVFGTMAKWATEIDDPERIPEIVSHAFHVAMNGRPGPVVIALPEDMLMERVSVGDALAADMIETWPGLTDMSHLQKMLWAAERPIAILGGSRWSEAACAAAVRFAERFDMPVATSFRRMPLFPATHPSYAGDLGTGVNPKLVARVKAADLLLLVGGRMGEMPSQGYTLLDIPNPKMKLDPRLSGPGRARSRLPARPCDQCHADRIRGFARRAAAAERDPLARLDQGSARGLPRLDRAADQAAGRGELRRDHGVAARAIAAREHHHQRGRQLLHLDAPLLPLHASSRPCSARPPARWVTACRRRSARSGSIRSAPWCASRATATS